MGKRSLKVMTARTPEREELAIRIAEHRALKEELAATNKALSDLEFRSSLRTKVQEAKAAVETAKQNAARHLTDSALGKASAPPQTVRAARDALQDAEDELEAALTVEAALKKQHQEIRDRLSWAENGLDTAFRAAVAADESVIQLFARYKELQRQLASQRLLVQTVAAKGVPEEYKFWDGAPPHDQAEHPSAAIAEWEKAFAELRVDPDAPLPEG